MSEQIDKKKNFRLKKPKKWVIWLVYVPMLCIIGLIIANLKYKNYTNGALETIIAEQLQPQLEELKKEFGAEDITLEIKIVNRISDNANIFREGYLSLDVEEYLISPSFTELENEEYTKETYEKYHAINNFFSYSNIFIENYYVRIDSDEDTYLKDSKDNVYQIPYYNIEGNISRYITKNNKTVYSSKTSTGGSSSGKCAVCNGTGYVKYYYGSSDWEAVLSGHDSYTTGKCTSCGGTGR